MDTDKIVTTPSDFDILSLLDGDEYPETTITLFTDTRSAQALQKIYASKDDSEEGEVEALRKKLHDTALIVTVQGSEPGKVMDVYAEDGDDEAHINTLIAMGIKHVETGSGKVDTGAWDGERVAALRRKLQVSELGKLIDAVTEVNFNAGLFDNAVDAGFSS
jgi:hypothetical protein